MQSSDKHDNNKIIRSEAALSLLKSIENDKFYGEVLIKIKNGEIVQISINKSYIDEQDIYDEFA